jgi:hypothetical protein
LLFLSREGKEIEKCKELIVQTHHFLLQCHLPEKKNTKHPQQLWLRKQISFPLIIRIANIDNTAYNLKYYMIRKAVDIICLASYIMNKETRN